MGATDKIKHTVDGVAGKAKEATGKASGDRSTQVEGKKDQAVADVKKAGDNLKSAVKH
jgi:uncharacterized protein YjbJ (UPF0337 family)